jgi:transcriptional regulator with XRE-family HTH domain
MQKKRLRDDVANVSVKKVDFSGDVKKILGENIRKARVWFNLTQKEIASVVGVTFQQIQKYEKGVSEISACKLHKLSVFFNQSVDSFFQEEYTPNIMPLPKRLKPQEEVNENVKFIKFDKSEAQDEGDSRDEDEIMSIAERLRKSKNSKALNKLVNMISNISEKND